MREANEFLEIRSVSAPTVYKAGLVLEEILTNIIKYAFDDRSVHEIRVLLSLSDTALTVEFVDDGREFNPLSLPEPKLCHSISDCNEGGLGILLVRKMSESVEYRRDQGKNILTTTLTRLP